MEVSSIELSGKEKRYKTARWGEMRFKDKKKVKSVLIPNFCVRIANEYGLKIFEDIKATYPTRHTSSIVIRYFDAPKTIIPLISHGKYQKTLEGKTPPAIRSNLGNFDQKFFDDVVVFVDPSLEYLYYEGFFDKFLENPKCPQTIKGYIKDCKSYRSASSKEYSKLKEKRYRRFIEDIFLRKNEQLKMVRDILNYQAKDCDATTLIPPTPLITNQKTLALALTINAFSREFSKGVLGKECATYFLLKESILKDQYLMDKIKKAISDSEAPLIVFKFKNMDLSEKGKKRERESYRDLMIELDLLRKNRKNTFTMVLENSFQVFPSACVGFDIVSTTLQNFEGDGGRYGKHGGYYHRRDMINITFDDVEIIIKNNKGKLPCGCEACKNAPPFLILKKEMRTWNKLRRKHHIFSRNEEMLEIRRAIDDKNVEFAILKLRNSELKNLQDLVPRV